MHTEVQSMIAPSKAHEALSRIGWLSTLPKNTRNSLLGACEMRSLAANSMLYGLDDPSGGIYGIADGFVDVLAAPGPFQMRLVHVASVGWWAGESAAASRTARRVELRTRTDVTAAYIGARHLDRLAEQDPAIWRDIATLTVRHLDTAMLYAAAFASPDLKLRLLMALVRSIGPLMDFGGSFSLPLGQAELAELAGLSRNTISRLLASLSDEGFVKRNYGSITVDVDRLKSLVDAAAPRYPA
jgi:CRP/FNR family transcriptional regulator, cyclic AMP receptor protein